MLRRLIAISAALLMIVPAAAGAEPAPDNPGQQQRADRLDLYQGDVEPDVAAALRAQGYDVVAAEPRGNKVRIEVVMSGSEAAKLASSQGLALGLKKNKHGDATADAAFEEGEDGFEVWRKWSSSGGLKDEMEFLADKYDDLTELITIGQSLNGEDIYAMRVTEKADTKRRGTRPAILNLSAQHAREWITPEVNRRLLHHYLENYGTDERITDILDTTEVWFIIVANPDGYDWTFTEGNRLWRKNLADNNGDGEITTIDGVDLNRNFATNWGQDNEGSSDNPTSQVYRGPAPTSEPETQALDALLGRYDFSFLVNYHSAAELLLYGTGNQVDSPTPDDLLNIAINGTDENPGVEGYDPDLSAELYITNGTTTGHAVAAHGIMAYTPELATCTTATSYIEDDEFGPTYCQDEGRSVFEFPDSEELVQFEFEKNLNYQLSIAESAADPAHPAESAVLSPAPDFAVKSFGESWGANQEVAVWSRREVKQLRMHASINGGPEQIVAASEWEGGERYGSTGNVWYAEYRATVTGQQPGDSVEVWFTAVDTPSGGGDQAATKIESEHFTYDVVTTSGADVLIVADNSPGTALGGGAPLNYLGYYTDALDANGLTYEVFDVGTTNIPDPMGVLGHFDAVVWYTGDKLVTDYQGGLNTTYVAHELNMVMRDYVNEGGKVLATGKNHGFEEFFPLNYGQNGAPTEVCSSNCLVLTDDVYQYWFGAFSRSRRGGLAPDGTSYDITGTGGAFDGYSFGLDGGDSADNQGATAAGLGTGTASFVVTSSVLPPDDFPLLPVTERVARWETGGGAPFEPVTGDWQVATDHDDVAYKRLSTTIDLTGAATATMSFATSYAIESDWDFMFVEAHTVGTDDWTTLPDQNGHTSQNTGQSCQSGWVDQLHPFLAHYMDAACNPTGSTGEWHAATGPSAGIEQWEIDLSDYAGSVVEVSISFATDWATGDLGVFVDDVSVTADGTTVLDTSFEDGLGGFTVPGSPEGSAPNSGDWERVGILFEIASIVATEDTLLFGFGFEGVTSQDERNEVMRRSMEHLLG